MISRIEQADAALRDVLPDWPRPTWDNDPTTSPGGLMAVELFTILTASGWAWCAVVSFRSERTGEHVAPIDTDPRDVLRAALAKSRQTLTNAISTLDKVTP